MAETKTISSYISDISKNRNTLRDKAIALKLKNVTETSKLADVTTAIDGIEIKSGITAQVVEGKTYTIPAGYHDGTTIVQGISDITGDKEKYKTQDKTVTPTKSVQAISSDAGYYALGTVTVNAIPDKYRDVSSVTATSANVLSGKIAYGLDANGNKAEITGAMANNGAILEALNTTTTSYTIPAGYHNGSGKVSITLEEKSATPGDSAQTITPASGKVLSKVTVAAVPDTYTHASDATIGAGDVLSGKIAYGYDSTTGKPKKITGIMLNHGAAKLTSTPAIPNPTLTAGYTSGITVDTPNEHKTVTLSRSAQVIYGGTQVSGQKYGDKFLTYVEVPAIDSKLQDVSGVTATAADVLTGKSFVNSSGTVVAGTIKKIEKKDFALTPENDEFDIETGYYYKGSTAGTSGYITVASEAITVTPKTTAQTLESSDNFYHRVTVNAIPSNYGNVSDATLTSADLLIGKTAYGKNAAGNAVKITGSMVNHGSISSNAIDGMETTSITIGAGYTTGGTISFDDSAIVAALEAI